MPVERFPHEHLKSVRIASPIFSTMVRVPRFSTPALSFPHKTVRITHALLSSGEGAGGNGLWLSSVPLAARLPTFSTWACMSPDSQVLPEGHRPTAAPRSPRPQRAREWGMCTRIVPSSNQRDPAKARFSADEPVRSFGVTALTAVLRSTPLYRVIATGRNVRT